MIKKILTKDRARQRFLLFGIIPVSILLAIMSLVSFVYNLYWEKNLKRDYGQSLRNCSSEIDNLFYEVEKTIPLLTSASEFKDLLYSPTYFQVEDQYKATNIKDALAIFSASKQAIHSVYIYKKYSGVVLTNEGSQDAESFFSLKQYSSAYSMDFYNNLRPNGLNHQILDRCLVENRWSNRRSEVIPIVNFVAATNSQNLLVVNIDAGAIAEILERNLFTLHSGIIMLEKDGAISVSTRLQWPLDPDELSGCLLDWPDGENTMQTKLSGEKVLIVKAPVTKNSRSTDYQFIAVVPVADMKRGTAPIRYFTIAMIGTSLFAGIWTSLRLQGQLYRPIRELLDMLEHDDPKHQSSDEFSLIKSQINRILIENSDLFDEMKRMLPVMQEQYILSLLNANEVIINKQLNAMLKKHNPQYKYPYFCVAVTTFRFTDAFRKEYGEDEKRVILDHLASITATVIPTDYHYYILNIEQYTLCSVANVDSLGASGRLEQQFHQLARMFSYDKEYINVQTGIGSVCETIENIHLSYRDALSAFSTLNPKDQNKTAIYQHDKSMPYDYSIHDNNRMVNYLLLGNRESAIALLEEVIAKNKSLSIPDYKLKEVLIQVFNTAILSLHGQGIALEQLMGEHYIDLFHEINTLDASKIIDYLYLLLEAITEFNGTISQKPEMESIKKYIDEHYQEDICLQGLSDQFGIQPKYLSKLLKEYLSMTFMQYLSTLRLEQAKKHLLESENTLDEVAVAVGYNSRNTFIRMFKKMEGVTPTEYRRMHKDK